MAGGEYCAIWLGPELPGDQRADDAQSVCFDQPPLDAPLDIVGAPERPARRSRPTGRRRYIAVRLCDVHPDGASTRITYGVLNLMPPQLATNSRKRSCPARRWRSRCRLDDVAYRVAAGQPPARRDLIDLLAADLAVAGTGHADAARRRRSTCRCGRPAQATRSRSREPEGAAPWRDRNAAPASSEQPHRRTRRRRPAWSRSPSSTISARCATSTMAWSPAASPARPGRIDPDDPLSAHGETHWTQTLSRNGWSVRTETFTDDALRRAKISI